MNNLIIISTSGLHGKVILNVHVFKKKRSNYLSALQQSYSKTCVKWPLSKRPKIGFQDQLLLLNACHYIAEYALLQEEHSAILSTFIKLPFVIKIFVLSFFEWLFYTGFTVMSSSRPPPSGTNLNLKNGSSR